MLVLPWPSSLLTLHTKQSTTFILTCSYCSPGENYSKGSHLANCIKTKSVLVVWNHLPSKIEVLYIFIQHKHKQFSYTIIELNWMSGFELFDLCAAAVERTGLVLHTFLVEYNNSRNACNSSHMGYSYSYTCNVCSYNYLVTILIFPFRYFYCACWHAGQAVQPGFTAATDDRGGVEHDSRGNGLLCSFPRWKT